MRVWLLAALLVSNQQPTFRSGTQVVQVDVRVSKDGKFVSDLKPEEFQILEDGVPQKIVAVTLVSDAASAAPSAHSTEHSGTKDAGRSPPIQISALQLSDIGDPPG